MVNDKLVVCGLTEEEVRYVEASIWDPSIEVFISENPTDSIMLWRVFALIINLDHFLPEEREFIQAYYEELIWFPETLIFTGEFRPNWNVTGQVVHISDLRDLKPNLRAVLQAAYSRSRNTENFRLGLVRSFQIAREIRNRPGVTTESLSKDLALSKDVVTWYVLLLQSAHELIEYIPETGGWQYFDEGEPGSLEQTIRSALANQAMRNELDGWMQYEDRSIEMAEEIKAESKKSCLHDGGE